MNDFYAYPRTGDQYITSQHGMTLRDYFAGQALAGLLSSQIWDRAMDDDYPVLLARDVYIIANSMLEERAKNESS